MKQWLQQIPLNNSFSVSLPWNEDTLLNSETPSINSPPPRVYQTVSLLPTAITEHIELVELFDPLLADNRDSSQTTSTVQDWDRYGKMLWKKILHLQSVIQILYISTFSIFYQLRLTAMMQSFSKEIMALLLLGVCCITTTFAWPGYSQIPISCLLTLRSHNLHNPRHWPPRGQPAIVILQMSPEGAIIPLTTWPAGSRQKGIYSACTSTWLMKTRSGAGRQHDAPSRSYRICVSTPQCSNGDQWLSNLTENLALQASPSKHKLCNLTFFPAKQRYVSTQNTGHDKGNLTFIPRRLKAALSWCQGSQEFGPEAQYGHTSFCPTVLCLKGVKNIVGWRGKTIHWPLLTLVLHQVWGILWGAECYYQYHFKKKEF